MQKVTLTKLKKKYMYKATLLDAQINTVEERIIAGVIVNVAIDKKTDFI